MKVRHPHGKKSSRPSPKVSVLHTERHGHTICRTHRLHAVSNMRPRNSSKKK